MKTNNMEQQKKENKENCENNEEIVILTIVGEVEGHEALSDNTKTTKYEHLLPKLASLERNENVKGILFLLNTVGGDVEAGLAIAEMIASMSKKTVTLVLGGSHSIGVPIAVSADYSFIVPSGTMVIHPVRTNGTVIGARQTYDFFRKTQERITNFVCNHCKIQKNTLEKLMNETEVLTKDIGTILIGEEAVKYGIIDRVGGISEALTQLKKLCDISA